MERRSEYYVPFTNHTQYKARQHNNTMQKCILNYTHLHECTMSMSTSYVCTHTSLELLNEAFLVKIVNSNVTAMLRGFHWYLYFVAQE